MKMKNNLKGAKPSKVITDLRHLVSSSAEVFGDRNFYLYKKDGEYVGYSFRRLWEEMNYIGTAFSLLGIMGKTVAVCGDTHPYYINTYFATVNGNGIIVPIDKELSPDAIVDFLVLSEAEVFVYTKSRNNLATIVAERVPSIRYFIPIEPDEDSIFSEKVISMEKILEMGKAAMEEGDTTYTSVELDMEKPCAILFTSGTTGTSKGVMLCQRNLTTATNSACQSMPYDDKATFVCVLPIHHTYEMTAQHLGALNIGGEILINDSLKHVMKNFALQKPNTLALVPLFVETMYNRIWDSIRKKGKEKLVRNMIKVSNGLLAVGIDMRRKFFGEILAAFGGNLTSIVCGGAPLSPKLVEDFYAFGITILEGYGITECSPLVAVNRAGDIKLHSVGKPVENCEVKIDKQSDEDETGEILVKGGNVMLGYYKNPEATAEVFTEDGWFRTGDIGYIGDEGHIFITGRKKNVIILSNGKNVFPEELEEYLSAVPEILESVVLARKNENGEEIITALTVPNMELLEGKTDDEIYALIKNAVNQINQKLPSFKQMRAIEIRKEPFERNTSKKIQRFKVK